MLRVSAQSNQADIDIQGVSGNASSADQGIEHGAQLMQFAEAVANQDEAALKAARDVLHDKAGARVLVDAAGVAANFQRMVRIADSIGIPYDNAGSQMSQEIEQELDLKGFRSAQHTHDQ